MGALPSPLIAHCIIKVVIQTVLRFGERKRAVPMQTRYPSPPRGGGLSVQGLRKSWGCCCSQSSWFSSSSRRVMKSQNRRTTEIGSDLWSSFGPPFLLKQGLLEPRILSRWIMSISTTSLVICVSAASP